MSSAGAACEHGDLSVLPGTPRLGAKGAHGHGYPAPSPLRGDVAEPPAPKCATWGEGDVGHRLAQEPSCQAAGSGVLHAMVSVRLEVIWKSQSAV